MRAISVTYGNAVQMGIPMSAAMFGEAGLGHPPDAGQRARADPAVAADRAGGTGPGAQQGAAAAQRSSLWQMLRSTLRNTVIHPVVLPVLLGLAWNLLGLRPARPGGRGAAAAGQRGGAAVPGADRPVAGLLRHAGQRARRARRDAAQAAGPAGAGAGGRALGLRPVGPAAVGAGDAGRAAGGQQRADLRAALQDAAGRGDRGDRLFHAGLRADRAAVAGACWGS